MSQTGKDLLIIYDTEAHQWAIYLQSIFSGPIPKSAICCYDISTLSSWKEDFLGLAQFACKLLILSKGMLEGLCQTRRSFLARVLSPAACVVVLLCGVDSLTPLLDLVDLNANECLQISTEQEAPEYLAAVTKIVRKGVSASNVKPVTQKPSGKEQKAEDKQPTGADSVTSSIVVIPPRVPCRSSTEVFILLKNESAGCNTEVEFSGVNRELRVKPVHWNERILCVTAPDFPAGDVRVNVYSGGVLLKSTRLWYYNSLEEITCLLSKAADPVDFMCQALQVPSLDKLDQKLSSMLLERLPAGGFQGLQCENVPERELHHADVPSLLHFAARYGFRSVSRVLLQCPGAKVAMQRPNRHGQTPTEIAKSHGHVELHVLLEETLTMFNSSKENADGSVYEMMCNRGTPAFTDVQKRQEGEDEEGEDEDLYAPLGLNDEYDTILNPAKAVVIANRPPAPTPRPERSPAGESRTPYIAQVFQKKNAPTSEAEVYTRLTKQGREAGVASTYDTFVPRETHEAQKQVGDRQEVQKDVKDKRQEKLSHLRSSVYGVAAGGSQRGNQPGEGNVYSKPVKGQQLNFFRKDKR